MANEIEKENLETHVALCHERYEQLKNAIVTLEDKLLSTTVGIKEGMEAIKVNLAKHEAHQNKILWFVVVMLFTVIGTLLQRYIIR